MNKPVETFGPETKILGLNFITLLLFSNFIHSIIR